MMLRQMQRVSDDPLDEFWYIAERWGERRAARRDLDNGTYPAF